jgi:hypothetical protein
MNAPPSGGRVRLALVLNQKVRGKCQPARGSADHMAEIAEAVMIRVGRDRRIKAHAIGGQQIGKA